MKDADVNAAVIAKASEWPSRSLGEIVEVLDSKRKPITKRDRVAGPYPYYGATGVLDWVDGFIFDEALVLIGEDGAKWGAGENSAFAVIGKTWVNNHAHVLRPIRDQVLDKWLIYYLNGADLADFISGMTVPKLNQGRLREIPIPLPPLEEQKRIVAVLDQAFAALDRARAHAEANLADAAELFESRVRELFWSGSADEAWKLVPLDELCSVKTGKKDVNEGNPAGYYPFFTCAKRHTYSDNFSFDGEACLIAGNGDVGNLSYYNGKFEAYQRTYVLMDFRQILGRYLFFVLQGSLRASLFDQRLGNTIPYIKKGMISDFLVPVPPLDVQDELIVEMELLQEKASYLAEICQRQLADMIDLRQSLLQEAFSGRLTA